MPEQLCVMRCHLLRKIKLGRGGGQADLGEKVSYSILDILGFEMLFGHPEDSE